MLALLLLTKDRPLGESHVLLLSALKKLRSKSLRAKPAINELASNANLEKEIASWRKR